MSLPRILILLAAAFSIWWFVGQRSGCGTKGALACPPPELEEGVGVTLEAAKVCPKAGFLCAGRRSFQVARWQLDQGRLRVRVSLPDLPDAGIAREIRSAAVEGIMEWDGHPFPITVAAGRFGSGAADIDVIWTQGAYTEGGGVGSRGQADGKRFKFTVESLSVAVPPIVQGELPELAPDGDPGEFVKQLEARAAGGQQMGPALLARIKASAMHEMGHALGLMHSDSANDIMFPLFKPGETQVRASARDLRSVDALYELPNGAMME